MATKQCSGETLDHNRCKNTVTGCNKCYLHLKQKGGSNKKQSKDDKLTKWLTKEIKRIYKSPKKHGYVDYSEPSVFTKGNSLVIGSFEEDDDPDEYFLTKGTYPNKLKVEHIRIKEKTIEKHIQSKYKSYKRAKKLENLIVNVSLSLL